MTPTIPQPPLPLALLQLNDRQMRPDLYPIDRMRLRKLQPGENGNGKRHQHHWHSQQ